MTIKHELTAADMTNCYAMLQAASPPVKNRPMAAVVSLYGTGGALALGYFFGLSTFELIVLIAFTVGLAALIILALKLARSQQLAKLPTESSMQREYLLREDALEIRMEDVTQVVPTKKIRKLESRERATLVHLATSTPMFLPFGSGFRSDFIEALQTKIGKEADQSPKPTAPGGRGST
jgi:hypothetical protein